MDYRKEIFPLSHFVLWTKGWYRKVHQTGDMNKDLEDTMRSIFTLDDYCGNIMISRDFAGVLLNQFEDYNNWARENGLHYWRLSQLIGIIREWQSWGYTENNAIIMAMREYFQCRNMKEIKLSKPVYSRQLYKKYDLIKDKLLSRSSMHGMTYTEMNRKVAEFNW